MGLTLNPAVLFDRASATSEFRGHLNPVWVRGTDTTTVDKLALVGYLRLAHRIRGADRDVRIDDREVSISFRGPGYTADMFIRRPAGTYQLTATKMGLMAVMNDLHKGRDTGRSWIWVIEVAAVFMTLVSITGLLLLFILKKRRVNGLGWLLVGAVVSGLAYWWLVA